MWSRPAFPSPPTAISRPCARWRKSCAIRRSPGLPAPAAKDIDRAWEALREAARPRIHTFISTSPLHMKFKLQMEPDAVHQAIIDSVTHARNLCEDVEWSAEDASRTDHDFLCRCVETAIKAGARTVNIPDTVGYAIPEEFAAPHRDAAATACPTSTRP